MLAVHVTDAPSVTRAFGIVDAVHSGMARAGVSEGEPMAPGDDFYLSPYATVAVPQLKRRRGKTVEMKNFLLFHSYKVRDPHFAAFDSLTPAAQQGAVLDGSIGYIFESEDEDGRPIRSTPLGAPVPESALRQLFDPTSPEFANFGSGNISTQLEDAAYTAACAHLQVAPDASWRVARHAEGRAAVGGQELLLAELPESVPPVLTDEQRMEATARTRATADEERRQKYAPTMARFRDINLQVPEEEPDRCVFVFSDGKRCPYDKRAGDLLFCAQCRKMVDDPLVVPPSATP